jgi:hypothetical protein
MKRTSNIWCKPKCSTYRDLSKLFVFSAIRNRGGVPNSDCGRFRSCQSLTLQQFSTTGKNFVNIVPGVFTPVLAEHTKSFNLVDTLSVGADSIRRNFEPQYPEFAARTMESLERVY